MPRPKAIPKKKTAKLTTTELGQQDKVIERRRFLLQLVRRGITQPDQITEMYTAKGYDVSERSIREDRLAVRSMLKDAYSDDIETVKDELVAQLDDLAVQFQKIAQDATNPDGKKSYYAAVQALGQKKDTIMSKAKLMGAVVEKQEVTGDILNRNMDVPAPLPVVEKLQRDLKRAGLIEGSE